MQRQLPQPQVRQLQKRRRVPTRWQQPLLRLAPTPLRFVTQ
jgi:hypothetical protein